MDASPAPMQKPPYPAAQPLGSTATDGFGKALLGVLALAVFVRWLAYSGFFGSDEVTYTERAFLITGGNWSVDDYVGANRLGVNLPVAAFAALLGKNELAAALYSLLCSLGEVALVTWAGWRMFGPRAGLMAGLLLASLPTHVHFAGRLMADAPLCLTISASFVCFYEGERRRWAGGSFSWGYFWAGVFAGLSFWIKPVTLFVFSVFLFYPLVARRIHWPWLWMAVGVVVAMAANCLLFWALTGRFWYIFEVMVERRSSGYLEAGAEAGDISSEPYFYLVYLFGKVYHTGAAGLLAAAGAMALVWRAFRAGGLQGAVRTPGSLPGSAQMSTMPGSGAFALFWALGLLLVLSVLPVSFSPLMFVPKQTNYMLIFVAPLCLLGGYALSRWPAWLAALTVTASVLAGLALALLLQGSVSVFTANSWATVRLAQAQPSTTFYVMSNAYRAAQFQKLIGGQDVTALVRPIAELKSASSSSPRLAVIDAESFSWDGSRPFPALSQLPACWQAGEVLRGEPTGLGAQLLRTAAHVTASLPVVQGTGIPSRLQRMSEPLPARIYQVPAGGC
jgi:4-amino-4-deoxy-L-arabinose transferase-like glycosyltransferase